MINLTFFGAAGSTTGSMHLVEIAGRRILLDCGLHQGHRKEAFERNRNLPVDAASIDAVLLSHAHIDHSGNLPTLARNGFRGRVYCTGATRDLCEIMLNDSAILQGRDVEKVNRSRIKAGKVPFEPLYSTEDVDKILRRFHPVPYASELDLGNGVSALFHDAGHILGSAVVQIDARKDGKSRRLVYTGDLGQSGQPLIRDPSPAHPADIYITESTYADRSHPPAADVRGRIKAFIEDIHQQKAKLIIPAFSVGRTQHILYVIHSIVKEGRIPPTPIYVDSPLSTKASRIYHAHKECYDEAAIKLLHSGNDPFVFEGLHFTASVEESKAINQASGPMVVLSASGMCEGGRILHHLRHAVGDPRTIILIVGFQAEHTLGRRIVDKRSPLRIYGKEYELQARVHTINALSAHADREELLEYARNVAGNARHLFAVHGEEESLRKMAEALRKQGPGNVEVPAFGQTFTNL